MTIGHRIKNLRTNQKLTQVDLGKLIGSSGNLISNYETNKTVPGLEKINLISNVLGTSVDYLVKGEMTNGLIPIGKEVHSDVGKTFSTKYELLLDHYRELIENNLFSEYDIMSFLIFIREGIDTKYKSIRDFCDLIAHRDRNRGYVFNCVVASIENNKLDESGKLENYNGIEWNIWTNEWRSIFEKFDIKINELTLKEITVCIISLAQDINYFRDGEKIGRTLCVIDSSGYLSLCTTGIASDNKVVCCLRCGQLKFLSDFRDIFIRYPITTKRINKKLVLCGAGKNLLIVE